MSYYYTYVPRHDTRPPKWEEPIPINPWVASAHSPAYAYAPVQAIPQPQAYYAAAPIPEPIKHNFWYGHTKAEVEAKRPQSVPVIPQVAAVPQQYYCRELNGSYTLRSTKEIMEKLQPGYWTYANASGYPYWVRTATR